MIIIALASSATAVAALMVSERPRYTMRPAEPVQEDQVIVNGKKIQVEVADTADEQSRGLSQRDPLPKDQGMLFVYNEEGIYSFWMNDMKFNLDIIWINDLGKVVHVEKNLEPCLETCPSHKSEKPARFVLEVNAGVADDLGIREGLPVSIIINNK